MTTGVNGAATALLLMNPVAIEVIRIPSDNIIQGDKPLPARHQTACQERSQAGIAHPDTAREHPEDGPDGQPFHRLASLFSPDAEEKAEQNKPIDLCVNTVGKRSGAVLQCKLPIAAPLASLQRPSKHTNLSFNSLLSFART